MSFVVKKCLYPNGEPYLWLEVHNKHIGNVTEVDGGFLATGRRKPVATVEEAAKQLLDSHISRKYNEISELRSMLVTVLKK